MTEAVAIAVPQTYRDYCGWDDGRWELIDGIPINMSPAPSRAHQAMVVELTAQLQGFFRQTPCRLYHAPFDVRLPEGDEADEEVKTVVQPDLLVVCDPAKLDECGCRGAPDWVIEVLSPATAARDQIEKRRLYERHGVREYWLAHPYDHLVTVYRQQQGLSFAPPEILEMRGMQPVSLFDGLAVDWDQVLQQLG